jgi:maltokinase
LPERLTRLMSPYLARQRWYAGAAPPSSVAVVESGRLAAHGGDSGLGLFWALVSAESDLYQLVLAERPDREAMERLAGCEQYRLGSVGGMTYYDATIDAEMALALLKAATGCAWCARTARPLDAEQSNTSLVFDDELIFKLFRRLAPGPSRDAELTAGLWRAGFEHVAKPLLRWRHGETDLAFGQRYLVGGTDGWVLALTSLRDLLGPQLGAPVGTAEPPEVWRSKVQAEEHGGDFAGEAWRLGHLTAEMHLALERAFGRVDDWRPSWDRLRSSLERGLGGLGREFGAELTALANALVSRVGSVGATGPAVCPHGDYHLGQVMRTDAGWCVLDFEGEPNRPLEERLAATSVLKDVAGMLRSFSYAAQFALAQAGTSELEPLADAWEERNREAFLGGYLACPNIGTLLPVSQEDREVLCLAFELEKAMYELAYERAYRPDWAEIPIKAIRRLLAGPHPARVGRLASARSEEEHHG